MKHLCALGIAAALAWSVSAFAAPGDLDPDFGDGGVLKLTIAEFTNADAIAQLASGPILLAGGIGKTGQGGDRDFFLAHMTEEGALDAAFGTDGFVADSVFSGGPEEITRILVQPDGKILAIGFGLNGANFQNILARYNADGSRDSSFGTNGVITPAPGFALAEDEEGNVLLGGNGATDTFTLTRYTGTGALDTGFGSGGTLTLGVPPAVTVHLAGIAYDADGKIVAVTKADDVVAVTRYFADGSPDTGFGTNGHVFNFCSNSDGPSTLAFQSDGKIIVGVSTRDGSNTSLMCLLRFTTGGAVDNTFDGDGKIVSDIPGVTKETVVSMAIMKDDRIVVGGEIDAAPGDSGFMAARFLADGAPDTTFSGDGFATFNLVPGQTDFGAGVAVSKDGRVLVSGASTDETDTTFFDGTVIALQGDTTDLSLTMTADRSEATVGDGSPVVFTITAKNKGPAAAFGVQVTDTVPASLTVASATSTVGSCSGGQNLVCDLGRLDPDAEATITLTTTPAAAATATNTASVSGQIGDSVPDDNTASVVVTISSAGGGSSGGGGSGGGCSLVP